MLNLKSFHPGERPTHIHHIPGGLGNPAMVFLTNAQFCEVCGAITCGATTILEYAHNVRPDSSIKTMNEIPGVSHWTDDGELVCTECLNQLAKK